MNRIEEFQQILVVNRIRILQLLLQDDTCVCQMVQRLQLKHNLISHHLKKLMELGYVKSTRNGQHIIYSLLDAKRKIVAEILHITTI